MAKMEARHTIQKYSTTWKELVDLAVRLNVPDDATFRVHSVPYTSPVDTGYDEVIWEWTV